MQDDRQIEVTKGEMLMQIPYTENPDELKRIVIDKFKLSYNSQFTLSYLDEEKEPCIIDDEKDLELALSYFSKNNLPIQFAVSENLEISGIKNSSMFNVNDELEKNPQENNDYMRSAQMFSLKKTESKDTVGDQDMETIKEKLQLQNELKELRATKDEMENKKNEEILQMKKLAEQYKEEKEKMEKMYNEEKEQREKTEKDKDDGEQINFGNHIIFVFSINLIIILKK